MLEDMYWGNSVEEYLHALVVFAAAAGLLYIVRRFGLDRLRALAKSSPSRVHDTSVDFIDQFRGIEGFLLALWIAVKNLHLDHAALRDLHFVILVTLTYRVVRILQNIAALAVQRIVSGGEEISQVDTDTARNISYVTNFVLCTAGLAFVLGSLGIKLTALLTGLGVGGVAVALAAQAILADLFSAIAILVDKPFSVGDEISLDDNWKGKVVRIGLKTTRARAPTGEMLIFPNSVVTSSKVRNISLRRERHVSFSWAVSRAATADQVRRSVELAKEAIAKADNVRFEGAHFRGIGLAAYDCEASYVVLDNDAKRYLDAHEKIQLEFLGKLQAEKIALAEAEA